MEFISGNFIGILIGVVIGGVGVFLAMRHNYRKHPGKIEGQFAKFDEEWARIEVQKAQTLAELQRRAAELEQAASDLRAAAESKFGSVVRNN